MPDWLPFVLLIVKMVLVTFLGTLIAEGVSYYRGSPMTVRGIQRSTAIGIGLALVAGYMGWLS